MRTRLPRLILLHGNACGLPGTELDPGMRQVADGFSQSTSKNEAAITAAPPSRYPDRCHSDQERNSCRANGYDRPPYTAMPEAGPSADASKASVNLQTESNSLIKLDIPPNVLAEMVARLIGVHGEMNKKSERRRGRNSTSRSSKWQLSNCAGSRADP